MNIESTEQVDDADRDFEKICLVLSLLLIGGFAFILYLPTTAEYQDDLMNGEDLMAMFLFVFAWLPLLVVSCVASLVALRAKRRGPIAILSAFVNAGFVWMLTGVFLYACFN